MRFLNTLQKKVFDMTYNVTFNSGLQPIPFQGTETTASQQASEQVSTTTLEDDRLIKGVLWGTLGTVLAYGAYRSGINHTTALLRAVVIGAVAKGCFSNASDNFQQASKKASTTISEDDPVIKGLLWGGLGSVLIYGAIESSIHHTTALLGTIMVGAVAMQCFSNASDNFKNSIKENSLVF